MIKIKVKWFCFLLIAVTSCAPAQNGKRNDVTGITEKNDCDTFQAADEIALRTFLYQAKDYWDSITEFVNEKQNQNQISEKEVDDYAIQNREFTKYFDNALTEYLRGDISSDFAWSLATVKQLLLHTQSCYPDFKRRLEYIKAFREDCILLESLSGDTIRTFLYRTKLEWGEIFIIMSSRQSEKLFTGEVREEFKRMDREFNFHFNNALRAYLKNDKTEDKIEKSLKILGTLINRGNIILDSRYNRSGL